jgi:hypothetical protein
MAVQLGSWMVKYVSDMKTTMFEYFQKQLGKKCAQADIKKVTSELNIQIDNLCQFLPQDRVVNFAKLTPQELLRYSLCSKVIFVFNLFFRETEKAVGSQLMVQQHEELIRLKNELKGMDQVSFFFFFFIYYSVCSFVCLFFCLGGVWTGQPSA